jgi:hypothetical protein
MAQSPHYGLRPPKERFNLLWLSDSDVFIEELAVIYLPDCAVDVQQAIDRYGRVIDRSCIEFASSFGT